MSAAVVASWARYAECRPDEVVDNRRSEVIAAAQRLSEDPVGFLRDPELFGDLADQGRFVDPYLRALTLLREQGVRVALEALVG